MTVQNVQTQKPVKNTLAKLENVRGISSAISCVAYVEEGDKALLSFTLDRMTTASGEHQAIFVLKNDFVSPNYNSMYSSGVLSSVTGNDVTFYNCIYDGTTKELTVKLFPELSTGSTKISNQRVLIILTSDAVFNSGETATVATSAEVDVDISKAFTNSTPIAMDTSTVGASIVASYGGINPPSVPSLPLHTVTFNTNGGSANPPSRSINPGATLVSLPPPPTRAHHTFMGWFNIQTPIEGEGTEFHANTPINSSMMLWARWRTNPPTILTPQGNEPVEHQDLNVTWTLVPNATYTIQMRNLRDNHITLPTENLPAGRGQFTIPVSALTAGDRHRVAVSTVTPDAVNGWDEREFNVRGATYNSMNRAELAQEILNRYNRTSASPRFINLRCWLSQGSGQPAGRNVFDNLTQTANRQQAQTPPGVNNTYLSEDMLRAILRMSDEWDNIIINAIAGAPHTMASDDEHHLGVAVDFQLLTNRNVSGANVSPIRILTFLEEDWGFLTQRNSGRARDPDYHMNITPNGGAFHLEIWGRN